MTHAHSPKPHHPIKDVPDQPEPGTPPVEPDEGPVPANIPEDPEQERVIAPGPNQDWPRRAAPGLGARFRSRGVIGPGGIQSPANA